MLHLVRAGFFLSLMILFGSCATPVSPTGGEPDRTGPKIIETTPDNGTVNFSDDEIEIEFDKFINRSTLQRALSIEPDLNLQVDINHGRKKATIEFESGLPDNTTIIIRIGTELTDTRSNKLEKPFQLALSTGPVIDRGKVTARVRSASDGSAQSGLKVFLIRDPRDIYEPANYIAETDTAGLVEFSFLGEGTYRPLWVADRNNNRIWEPEREAAQPFYTEKFELKRGDEIDIGTMYLAELDTVPPVLEGVGLLTEDRLRLRFDEEVFWEDDSRIELFDSLMNPYTTAYPIFVPPEDPLVLMAQSERGLSPDQNFLVEMVNIRDEAGNEAFSEIEPFPGSAVEDTVSLKLLGSKSVDGVFPDEPVVITYNKFIDDPLVTDSLIVIEGDRPVRGWDSLNVDKHRLYIYPEDVWQAGISYEFRVWDPFDMRHQNIRPKVWQRNQLGEIAIAVEDADTTGKYEVRIRDKDENVTVSRSFEREIEIDGLPALEYTVVVFRDLNENGMWDSGIPDPYRAPEPYFVQRKVPVREGFTSEINVEFNTEIRVLENDLEDSQEDDIEQDPDSSESDN
jgi:hypothetical protein